MELCFELPSELPSVWAIASASDLPSELPCECASECALRLPSELPSVCQSGRVVSSPRALPSFLPDLQNPSKLPNGYSTSSALPARLPDLITFQDATGRQSPDVPQVLPKHRRTFSSRKRWKPLTAQLKCFLCCVHQGLSSLKDPQLKGMLATVPGTFSLLGRLEVRGAFLRYLIARKLLGPIHDRDLKFIGWGAWEVANALNMCPGASPAT